MANQSPDRRRILEILGMAAAVGQYPGFCRWVSAAEHHMGSDHPVQPRAGHYEPQFFSGEEYKVVDQITELIIPRDEAPGARDAGVSEFIDFMVTHDDEIQGPFRKGLVWLDSRAEKGYRQKFAELPVSRQEELLRKLAYRSQQSVADTEGNEFFKLIRNYTVMGYYTSRVGLEQLDYPGLKFYSASPECPHKDDPEHRHLPPARY